MLNLLCPKEYISSIFEVDLDSLRKKGISLLLLDLDNTLVEWHKKEASSEIVEWFSTAQGKGFCLCILSNNSKKRVAEIADFLEVPFIHKAVKPRRKAFQKAMDLLGYGPESTGVIGDQIFTDILGGNRLGLYTILVMPLTNKDFVGTKLINRQLEKLVLRKLSRKGLLNKKQGD